MKIKKYIFLAISFLIITACKNHLKKTAEETNSKNHWSYAGETSPEHWTEIEKNSDCNGKRQSPINIININTKKSTYKNALNINYNEQTVLNKVVNNGHSIQFNFEKGDSIQYQEKTYHLAQIHFHEPSEHTIDGIRYPLEIHLVHSNSDKKYTVMSVLAKEGEESQLFEFFEGFLPLQENEQKTINTSIDLTTLFPDNKAYYSYGGSLTTPPCTERVNWVIFKEPIIVSEHEVLKLKNNMPIDNYRNEQALNDRIVAISTE